MVVTIESRVIAEVVMRRRGGAAVSRIQAFCKESYGRKNMHHVPCFTVWEEIIMTSSTRQTPIRRLQSGLQFYGILL